jgi:hypothetical protein
VRSVFSEEKKLSIAALSQTLPDRLIEQTTPWSASNRWNCSLVYWANSSGGRNALMKEVAMKLAKRRSDRSGRATLFSPGRPSLAGRDERRRFWAAIAVGLESVDAALAAGVPPAIGTRWVPDSRVLPAMFGRSAKPLSGRYLSFTEREKIGLLRAQGYSKQEVASRLGRAAVDAGAVGL